jgi:hypothetical protein
VRLFRFEGTVIGPIAIGLSPSLRMKFEMIGYQKNDATDEEHVVPDKSQVVTPPRRIGIEDPHYHHGSILHETNLGE